MDFLILRVLTHSELGMFHEYRKQGKEGSRQRAVNFDWDVVDRVFPAAKDVDRIEMDLQYPTDTGTGRKRHWLKRQEKNWRLEGNCPTDRCYSFVEPGCLFAMEVDSGFNPGIGSWAVFPKDDAVTTAILADGESSGLAQSAMIALHGDEGSRARAVLAAARPGLFTACARPPAGPPPEGEGSAHDASLPPNPRRLVKILASVGHTLVSAVADLVDNAISANATKIAIAFGRPDDGHGRWMSIADNGDGMTAPRLREAMRIGSDAEYEANSLGKYGYGLKGASWSQADVFTVATRTSGGEPACLTWDVDAMDGWVPKSDPLEPWEQQATAIPDKGTVVLWKRMRPPLSMPTVRGINPHSAEVMELERHLSLVFHRFLEGKAAGRQRVSISINGRFVEPNNPVGHPLTAAYDAKPVRIPVGNGFGDATIQAFLLPSEEELNHHHAADGAEAIRRAHDLIGLHGKRNDTQGLFIYRNDRLIKWGGWHQLWATNDEKTKLARVVVDFDTALDDALAINISKQIVQLPQLLQAEIRPLADVARKDSQKKYRRPAPPAATAVAANGGQAPAGSRLPVAPGAGTGAGPVTTNGSAATNGSTAGSGPLANGAPLLPAAGPARPSQAAPRVAVRSVSTTKFVWRVTSGLTGAVDVQVSDVDPNLSALAKHLSKDPQALSHLAGFLNGLDKLDVQKALLPGNDD